MFTKEKLYSLIILSLYLLTCFTIFNGSQKECVKTNLSIKNTKPVENDIIGKIVIDKINLQKPLYKIESEKNNVDKNVTILKESTFPDKEKSILFIASHSGDSNISYFEHLDELRENDIIKITYHNKEYLYQVSTIWEEEKNGYIHINRQYDKQLILTTCSPTHKDKQLIISSKLI